MKMTKHSWGASAPVEKNSTYCITRRTFITATPGKSASGWGESESKVVRTLMVIYGEMCLRRNGRQHTVQRGSYITIQRGDAFECFNLHPSIQLELLEICES